MTPEYVRLDENEMDAIDCAIYSSDMFHDKENRDHLKRVLTGWLKKLEEREAESLC